MDIPLEEELYKSILNGDHHSVSELLRLGANPNTITDQGKTCLGEAAHRGNEKIVKLLLDAYESTYEKYKKSRNDFKRVHSKLQKGKLWNADETVIKFKNEIEKSFRRCSSNVNYTLQNSEQSEHNQGYFVCKYSEDSSSDESSIRNSKSPSSPTSLVSSLQAELEWDEEEVSDAPTTSEDETWSSIYIWYATILESTGSAIAHDSASKDGIDQQDAFMKTALHYAVESRHLHIVKLIIEAGCNVDSAAADGLTSLHVAVMQNNKNIVLTLLAAGSQVNYKTHEKTTPLHIAASRGFLEMVKILVSNGACIEARDICDRTPLYLATSRGHINIVNFLISIGANVNGEQANGYTPLCDAVWARRTNIAEALLKAGARIPHSHKLLHNAVATEQVAIIKLLIKMGSSINLHNERGDTPLLLSAKLSKPEIARILLENGADVDATNSITGATALHTAVEFISDPRIFDSFFMCLLEYGADLDSTALAGETPLTRALLFHQDYATFMLIRHGADVNMCSYSVHGFDNLSLACRRHPRNFAKLLLQAGYPCPAPDPNQVVSAHEKTKLWLQQACKHPLSLLDISRIEVRRHCGYNIRMVTYINSLPLPKSLKSFLMFENEVY